MSFNQTTLMGRLGQDPSVTETPNGKKVCRFSIATTETWSDSSGEKKENVDWHNIEAWGKNAEFCEKYLSKGKNVLIIGSSHTERSGEGTNTKYYHKVKLKTIKFADSKKASEPMENNFTTGDIPFD
jgi:single-strand DNA-binding protein